ncbi:CoA transferase [Phenylobacterium sp.]|uniref:CoA transferase n=1 Tax=Phenylobacterium sp. TaxID=1871053 RepID=UPI00121007F0|nr:CoA transferase [Phenylobacterium sp.]THD63854.1 MAG: carnitine dehydratase [Phenylobacterium sp.]
MIASGEALTQALQANLATRKTDSEIDLQGQTEAVMNLVGATGAESGGCLTFYGKDPILPTIVPFASMSAIGLAAKALQVASIWRLRTGQPQDIHVDVRKAMRRYGGFYERKWETVNGYLGGAWSDPNSPFEESVYETKDGRWVLPTDYYPKLHQRTSELLNAVSTKAATAAAIRQWNGEDLETAAAEAGVVMALARPLQEILEMGVYTQSLRDMPLIEVTKIADSAPKPFAPDAKTPLDGVRALGLAHVIAGPAIGRALALHGADVLNIWNPQDWEHDILLYASHIGMRSARLDLKRDEAHARFRELLGTADVFFSNRRPHYLEAHDLGAARLCRDFPGLIHARVCYAGREGPWSDRVGFDTSTAYSLGLACLEGTDAAPKLPAVAINDFVTGWLGTVGILQALKRRAVEGGSYRVTVSLSRTTLWLMSLGIFDKDYARYTAGSCDEHSYPPPDLFTADTPMGRYTGMTEQVEMSATPGHYAHVLEPRGSALPEWLSR